MTIGDDYSVVTTGQILDGFAPEDVQKHLVSILGITPEQAERFFEKPRFLKKGVSWAAADKLCGQLAKLGLAAEIQSPEPVVASEDSEPERSLQDEPALELVQDEPAPSAGQTAGNFECPSCHHVQPKSEQCESCGIWFHKLDPSTAPPQPENTPQEVSAAVEQADDSSVVSSSVVTEKPDSFGVGALAAASIAALLGALLWKFIAVTFAYELGLIAWGIGGAVGVAAASAGSRGFQAGLVCAVLAFGSIAAGKYWAYSAFVDDFQEAMAGVSEFDEEMQDFYDEQMEDARLFAAGSGSDIFVRRFMVEREYSYATSAADVTAEELAEFREYIEPELREMALNPPNFEEWQSDGTEMLDELTPWAMMHADFGLLDIVFIFLGVGTAFRLGSE